MRCRSFLANSCLLFLSSCISTSGFDNVCQWQGGTDANTWQESLAFGDGQLDVAITKTVVSLDGDKVVALGWRKAGIWSLGDNQKIVRTVEVEAITAAWSLHGDYLAFGANNGYVYLWSVASENSADWTEVLSVEPQGLQGHVTAIAWSPDNSYFVYALSTGDLIVQQCQFSAESSQCQKAMVFDVISLMGPYARFVSLAWSPDSTRVLAGGNNGVSIWDVSKQHQGGWTLLENIGGTCANSVAWSPDSEMVVSGNCKGLVTVWKIGKQNSEYGPMQYKMREFESTGNVTAVSWSSDSSKIAFALESGAVSIYNVDGDTNPCGWSLIRSLLNWNTNPSYVDSLGWSRDGTTLTFGGQNLMCADPGVPMKKVLHATVVSIWFVWTIVALAIFVLMLVGALVALRRNASTGAMCLLIAVATLFFLSLLYIVIGLLGWIPMFDGYAHYFVAQVMPGVLYATLNFAGMLANTLHGITSAVLNVKNWFREFTKFLGDVKHYSALYNRLVPSHDMDIPASMVASLPGRQTALEPLIGIAPEESQFETLQQAAEAIKGMVTSTSNCGYDIDSYQRVTDVLETPRTVTVGDIRGFVRAYIFSTISSLRKSFTRKVWMNKAIPALKKRYARATPEERHSWLLMSDQCDWYLKNDLKIVDIAVAFMKRDDADRGASVLRLWASIDHVLAFIPKLLFSPLWDPSPSKRARDLGNRLQVIDYIAGRG